MSKLPPSHPWASETSRSAYSLVLAAEELGLAGNSPEDVMNARIVGYLMISLYNYRYLLGDGPISRVTLEVVSGHAVPSAVIYELGKQYRERLLRAFRSAKGPLPQPSEHLSRPSFDTKEEMVADCLDESGNDCRAAKKRALVRDGFRCVVSKHYDRSSVHSNQQLELEFEESDAVTVATQCCHILAESTTQGINPDDPKQQQKRQYAASVLNTLRSFGLEGLVSTFSASGGIHHLSNLLTMWAELHSEFDQLSFWLEPTKTPHEYIPRARARRSVFDFVLNKPVRFEAEPNPMGEPFPLPDPRLLAIHAACAQVAHLSGAADFFFKEERDLEDIKVLAKDGSSAAFLVQAVERASLMSTVA